MEQFLAHLWGDYILQSDYAANNKTSKNFACFLHVVLYGVPFLFLTFSPLALLVIIGTHFLIDRFRLAKYLVFAKNYLSPPSAWTEHLSWENCKGTGYPSQTPPFLAVWLMIFADNILHLTINYFAFKYL
jgi:hypothetical protein